MEETAIGFQYLLRSRPTQCDQVRGYDSALGCVSSLKRLGHGAEIFSQAAGLTGDQPEGVQNLRLIEARQLCRSRCGTEGSACARRMKSILIVAVRASRRVPGFISTGPTVRTPPHSPPA